MSAQDVPSEEDLLFREAQAYPEVFPVSFSHR
jgi:hypothetical protein